MKTFIIRIAAAIISGFFFGLVAIWAAGDKTLTDGQYIGYPLLAAMAAFCFFGAVWERTAKPKR